MFDPFILYYRLRKYEEFTAAKIAAIGQLSEETSQEVESAYQKELAYQNKYSKLGYDPNSEDEDTSE